jgi:hypothetical protein
LGSITGCEAQALRPKTKGRRKTKDLSIRKRGLIISNIKEVAI